MESLPTPVSTLSARVLEASGIYLMENGVTSILHFGPEVPGNLIEALLGTLLPACARSEAPAHCSEASVPAGKGWDDSACTAFTAAVHSFSYLGSRHA